MSWYSDRQHFLEFGDDTKETKDEVEWLEQYGNEQEGALDDD